MICVIITAMNSATAAATAAAMNSETDADTNAETGAATDADTNAATDADTTFVVLSSFYARQLAGLKRLVKTLDAAIPAARKSIFFAQSKKRKNVCAESNLKGAKKRKPLHYYCEAAFSATAFATAFAAKRLSGLGII